MKGMLLIRIWILVALAALLLASCGGAPETAPRQRGRPLIEGQLLGGAWRAYSALKRSLTYEELTQAEREQIRNGNGELPAGLLDGWLNHPGTVRRCGEFVKEMLTLRSRRIGDVTLASALTRVQIGGQFGYCFAGETTLQTCGAWVPVEAWWSNGTVNIGQKALEEHVIDVDPDAPGGPVAVAGCRTSKSGGPERVGRCYPEAWMNVTVDQVMDHVGRDATSACQDGLLWQQIFGNLNYTGKVLGYWQYLQLFIRHVPLSSSQWDQGRIDAALNTLRAAFVESGGNVETAPLLVGVAYPFPFANPVPSRAGLLTSLPYLTDNNNGRAFYARTIKRLINETVNNIPYHASFDQVLDGTIPSDMNSDIRNHMRDATCLTCHRRMEPSRLFATYDSSVGWHRRKLGNAIGSSGVVVNGYDNWITDFLQARSVDFRRVQFNRLVRHFFDGGSGDFSAAARGRIEPAVGQGPMQGIRAFFQDEETLRSFRTRP